MASQTKNTFNKSKVDSKPENSGPRTYNIKVSLTAIITVSVLFLICFGWSFLLGVMVGRDYDPESVLPQFSEQSTVTTDEQIKTLGDDGIENNIAQSTEAASGNTGTPKENEEDKIIKIEELNFASSLKGKPGEGKLAITPRVKDTPKNKGTTANNKSNNIAKNKPVLNAKDKSKSTVATSTKKMPSQITRVKQGVDPKLIYDFVLQVATFKDADAVDKVRAELEGHNLRTRMTKWKGEKYTFYSVLVVFRGTEEKAQGLNKIFKKLRLGQAIQKEKKLVKN